MEKYTSKKTLINEAEFLDRYDDTPNDKDTKYGLPNEVIFCKQCVISNQRPNSAVEFKHTQKTKKKTIGFNENRVCDACLQAEKKKNEMSWSDREQELRELCDRYRKKDGGYDCLVPGSGGKDSFYAAHILKYKFGMNPLTVTWAPHLYTDWGWKNMQSWIHAGFDNYLLTPNGRIHRLLTRLAVENLFHPFQPFILGQKLFAPKMAAHFDIPLVFYGENEAEYGNPVADNDLAKRSDDYFTRDKQSDIYLSGVSIQNLKENFDISDLDLSPYLPANPELMAKKKVDVRYLGYYLPWHPQGAYYYAVENSDFKPAPERTVGTYSKYNGIDDKMDDFNFYSYYIKFGIGRATYDASQEVRNGDITREEGAMLIKKYEGEFPERFSKEIFEYLSISENEFPVANKMFEQPTMDRNYFDALADSFRSPHLWQYKNSEWLLRRSVFNEQ